MVITSVRRKRLIKGLVAGSVMLAASLFVGFSVSGSTVNYEKEVSTDEYGDIGLEDAPVVSSFEDYVEPEAEVGADEEMISQ